MNKDTFLGKIKDFDQKLIIEVNKVTDLAEKIYASKTCSWGESMLSHSLNVAAHCLNQNLDPNTIKLAILHDIGLFLKESEIDKLLPKEKKLATLIKNYTSVKSLAYKINDQKTTISLTTKLILSTSSDIRILIVKLFDKFEDLKNYNSLPTNEKSRLLNRIKRIYSPLADFIGMGAIKREFDDTTFMYENESEYKEIKRTLDKYEDEHYQKSVKKKIVDLLASQNIRPIKIFGRAKGVYSTYEKILGQTPNDLRNKKVYITKYLSNIRDKYGITILVKTVDECYQVSDLIKTNLEIIKTSEKDYITNPKSNGYRAIQLSIFTTRKKDVLLEIQIKTPRMHLFNEYGPASHIAYKVRDIHNENLDKDLYVFEKLQRWKDNSTGKNVYKLNLFKDSIFVFTPTSEVIRLPKGATSIDFAYKIHTEVGDHCIGAKINGIMAKFSDTLKTGDIVEIITTKKPNVRKDWLKLAKDTETLGQIRKSLRTLNTNDTTS